ncbi:MAG: glycosyltransferase [bacterium]
MTDAIVSAFYLLGLSCFLFGLQTLFYLPLSGIFVLKKRKKTIYDRSRVSVVVPAYNEERVIGNCVESILASNYDDFEVILVDDGSTDNTLKVMRGYEKDARVKIISKSNGGKAAALNAGIARSTGQILFFIDGDTLFQKDTMRNLLAGFDSEKVGAVCGHDSPVNLQNWQLKLINIQAHVGTGFVRRALSVINALPIVSGNIGAFRRDVLEEIGYFKNDFIGEDLELTFRVHKAGYKVAFQPRAQVFAESPHTIQGLWNQRVRWARGFIQTLRIHKDMIFNPSYGSFGVYLGFNVLSMVVIPVLQFLAVLLLPALFVLGKSPVQSSSLAIMGWLGLGFTGFITVYSIILDKAYGDLKYAFVIPFWVPYSLLMDLVVIRAIHLELTGREALWNKAVRSGVVSKKITATRVGKAAPNWRTPVFAASGLLVTAIFIGAFWAQGKMDLPFQPFAVNRAPTRSSSVAVNLAATSAVHATAIHFEQNEAWRDAYRTLFKHTDSSVFNTIGVGAGRLDWNYFRWPGHESLASSYVKNGAEDLLLETSERLKEKGYQVIAILDLYAPRLISEDPGLAARNYHGLQSKEQLCSTALTEGRISDQLESMVDYLTRNYPIDGVVLTEIAYHSYCYDRRCFRSYSRSTGNKHWPKTWLWGGVDIDAESVGRWRSAQMAHLVERLAAAAHENGKELWVDANVDWDDFANDGRSFGLDYSQLLRFADKLVIWDYFAMENKKPTDTYKLAKYLSKKYDPGKIVLSLGLWTRNSQSVAPESLQEAIRSSAQGGIDNIWITPSHMFTPSHWDLFNHLMGHKRVKNKRGSS